MKESLRVTYTAQQIRDAIDAGLRVTCLGGGYEVIKDKVGQYLIHFVGSDYYTGLSGMKGTEYENVLNGSDFKILDPSNSSPKGVAHA